MSAKDQQDATFQEQEEFAGQQASSAARGRRSGFELALLWSAQEAQRSSMEDDIYDATEVQGGMGASAAHSLAAATIIGGGDESKGTASHSADSEIGSLVDLTSGAQAQHLVSSSLAQVDDSTAVVTSSHRSSTSSSASDKAKKAEAAKLQEKERLDSILLFQQKRAQVIHPKTSSSLASLAQLSGEDKAIGLLIVYNDSGPSNDSFRVTVDKSKDALVAGVFSFLEKNKKTLEPWIKLLPGKLVQLPESTLLGFHIILHLHALQMELDPAIFTRINISLLSSSSLQTSLTDAEDNVDDTVDMSDCPSLLHLWHELSFASNDPRCSIRFRHCHSLKRVAEGVPLRVVFIDSLIWLQEIGDLQTIKERMKKVFAKDAGRRIPAVPPPVILPKPEWEEFVEDKPAVYEKLKEHMLPTVWVKLTPDDIKNIRSKEIEPAAAAAVATSATAAAAAPSKTSAAPPLSTAIRMHEHYKKHASDDAKKAVQEICGKLLATAAATAASTTDKKKKAYYFIKGGFSDCGTCSSSFTFAPSKEDPEGYGTLPGLIYIWTRNSGQTSFGLQELVEGFQTQEYRFWFTSGCTPNSAAISWRYACMLQSGVTSKDTPAITVEQSCVLTPEANACYDLAHALIQTPYIQGFLAGDNPMPALRLDCGWNLATGKAFLNEMAVSPGGWIFSECHKLDILCHVAKSLVGFMKPHLQEKPAAAAAAAAAAADAADAADAAAAATAE